MAKFVDINSLTEKVNPDGNEQIQVSDTQKFIWKNALMNSGGLIGAILSYATQYAKGDTTNRKTLISLIGQLFYNTGSRADSFFRFVCGSVTIPSSTDKQEYFGIVFYDAYYTRTYAVFFGFENNSVPITFFQRQGNYVTDSPIDDNFVTNIINGTKWTKLGTVDFDALLKQTYGTNTQFLAPVQGSEVLLTTTVERILYALGFRGTNTNFRFLTGVNNTSETYWGVAFYNSGQSKTFTVLFGIGGSSIPVGMYQKAGNVTTQKSVDNEFIQDVLSTWTKSWSLNSQGTIYTPNDGVLTVFPSGYRTVIPGENLTTNLTSGTLKIKVPDLLTAQIKAGPFRDAVIDVPYGVTVQFADQVDIVYKADDVDGFTATSGRKVYTIHFVFTTSSTTNITFRAFVNVTNYKDTSKTVPKTLTYQFENSSGMGLSIVQGNPENPLTSRTVNVPSSNDPYVITSRLSSEGNITPMISVKSENNWVLNIRVYLRKYGTTTDTFLGGLNIDKDHYGTNTISGTTKVNFGDTLIYRINLLDGVLTSKSLANTFPTGSTLDPAWALSLEDLYTTSSIGMELRKGEPYPYNLVVDLGPSTKGTFDCNAVVEFYEKYRGKIDEVTFHANTAEDVGNIVVGMDTNKKVVMYLKYATSASIDPPTPSKVAIDFTVGISPRSPGTETTIFIYNKARTQLLKHVTYESGDVVAGISTKFTNIPNSDNNVYYLVITGSVNRSELFNFYDGGVYIF